MSEAQDDHQASTEQNAIALPPSGDHSQGLTGSASDINRAGECAC
jgi:hypothetical protein